MNEQATHLKSEVFNHKSVGKMTPMEECLCMPM